MPTNSGTTPLQNLTFPTLPDPASPDNQKELAQQLDSRIVMRFVSAAARDAAINSPVDGMTAHLADSGKLTSFSGGAWSDVGGPMSLRPPCVQVVTDSTVGLTSGDQYTVPFQRAEIDTHGMWDGGTGLVAPVAGIYRATGSVGVASSASAAGVVSVFVGLTEWTLVGTGWLDVGPEYAPYSYPRPEASGLIQLAAGDVVTINVIQLSGVTQNLYGIFGAPTAMLEMSLVSL